MIVIVNRHLILSIVAMAGFVGVLSLALQENTGHEKVVSVQKLPNVPGKSITAVVVNYAPGGKSPAHQHAGSVLAYVLSGSIRSQNSATGPVRVYKAGESFFEPPSSLHLISENGSSSEPASLLAIFVADDDVKLTGPATPNESR